MINLPTLLHYICRSTAARSVVFPARSPPALSWVTLLTFVRECSALLPTILLSVLLVCRCRQLHGLLNNTTSKCLTRLLKPTIVLEPHPGAFTNIPNPRRHQPPDTRVQRACLRFHKVRHRLPRGIPTTTGEPSRPLPLPGWHLITARASAHHNCHLQGSTLRVTSRFAEFRTRNGTAVRSLFTTFILTHDF